MISYFLISYLITNHSHFYHSIVLGSSIWAAKTLTYDSVPYILEDRYDQDAGVYYKKVPGHGNVVGSETAVDILTVLSYLLKYLILLIIGRACV